MSIKTIVPMLISALLFATAGGSRADAFPSKPIRIFTPAPAGGISDGTLRVLGTELSKMWGQQVVIETKAGASGWIAQQAVMASPPDGHALGIQASGYMISLPLAHGEQYSSLVGVTPVSFLFEYGYALTVAANSPYNSWKDLVGKLGPGGRPILYGTAGIGTTPHMIGELIRRATGANLQDVPYKGDAPIMTDILGGQTPLGLPVLSSALPMAKAGRLKFIGAVSESRFPDLPDVPTMREQGVDVVFSPWCFLYGPAGMPAEVVAKIRNDVATAMRAPAVRDFFAKNALAFRAMDNEPLRARIKADMATGQALIRDLNIPVN